MSALLNYEPDFGALIEAVVSQLRDDPWNLELLYELRCVALHRKAFGIPDMTVKVLEGSNVDVLLNLYRQMAFSPTTPKPLKHIATLIRYIRPTLTVEVQERAAAVEQWALTLCRRMTGPDSS
jgi:hypothetical protein